MEKNQTEKDIILFVGALTKGIVRSIDEFKKKHKGKYRIALLKSNKRKNPDTPEELETFDIILTCNFDSRKSIVKALKPIESDLVAVSCRAESKIPALAQVVPHVPYLRTPTSESLEWSTNKVEMRRRLLAYDPKITPAFTVVRDSTKKTLKKIEENVGFPLVIKPSGLAQSLLVTICFHQDELEKSLNRVFRKINRLHKDTEGRGKPQVLVERFMEGEMYSVDAYINSRGKVYFCPMVHIKTGRAIGFDDFFGYQQITPTNLSKKSIRDAREASEKAVRALGLRSSTAHIELYKTEQGWKIIELGPRIGGFRNIMYKLSYDIDHTENDIFIRIPKQPKVPQKKLGYTAVLKIFAEKEGTITSIKGIKKLNGLESLHRFKTNKRIGDKATFAKHGGKSIFNITLFNKDRSRLLADIRRIEQGVNIEVK
ncbi:MAG: ATP-grasp domain-containing protein [Candidatus Campbellbacteria bacterium]|nr:ATP-grasp domain-containing protein [Candidatus Campbellbacteria bacterium]